MLGIGNYLWRLVPGNPILVRVVESRSKRKRDLLVRCGYLGLLVIVVCASLLADVGGGTGSGLSLSQLSQASVSIFRKTSYLQLALVALLAPIFTAGAITQERDSQTYDVLLATPLTNGQIVLGSLLSRLFFVVALLISGIPIFSITQIFGGVALGNVALSFGIAAATAAVTGALAMSIATFRVGTRRTIFSFYLFIVAYLIGLILLDQLSFFHRAGHDAAGAPVTLRTSWLTGINPFLALRTINDTRYTPPLPGELPPDLRTWPISWYLTSPASFYIEAAAVLSLALILPAILLLRRMAQSTSTWRTWLLTRLRLSSGNQSHKPRPVWQNPIAWREARTKASATKSWMLRAGFMLFGIGGAITLLVLVALPGAKPALWIDSGSYDPANGTLFIHGDNKTYGVTPATAVLLDGRPMPLGVLSGTLALTEPQQVSSVLGPRGTLVLDSVKLTHVASLLGVDQARQLLLGATLLEVAIILLVVTNAAASTVTREKEDGTLDLLLATPITSRYYLWGKLRGLVSFVLPLVAVPVISAMLFVGYDVVRMIATRGQASWTVVPQSILIMPVTLIVLAAFASILGMQMSLRCRTTVRAVMSSLGIVLGICGALSLCGFYSLDPHGAAGAFNGSGTGTAGLVIASFSPFTSLALLLNPGPFNLVDSPDAQFGRWLVLVTSWILAGIYAGIVFAMYKSMVVNFDMTIRRQAQ
jgi:ABC-type transport system involved in multi-copper enzyme maturation permease subunit